MIDEKKLTNELKVAMNDDRYDGYEPTAVLYEIFNMIKQQPKVGDWIPCSERMPNISGYYLVTFKVSSISFVSIKHFNTFCFRWEDIGNGKITAWQPLPEPWEGEEE